MINMKKILKTRAILFVTAILFSIAGTTRAEGRHAEIHQGLFAAYWSEGRDIGDLDVLVEIAAAAGLDADKAREVLECGAYADRVRESTITAHRLGVSGVPAWVVDDKVLIPGAQPHEVFDQVLAQMGHRPAG